MGKTNSPRPANRVVQISHIDFNSRERLMSVRRAPTLKQALTEYFKQTLEPNGAHSPIYKGNTLSVKYGSGINNYVAKEAK